MKTFLVSILLIFLVLTSGCAPKYSQYYSQEGNFKVLLPDVKNVMSSCKTENQIKSCIAISSDKGLGSFFVHSEKDLSGAYAGLSDTQLLNISNSFIENQCNPLGLNNPIFPSVSEPKMEDMFTDSGTYHAVKYEWYDCTSSHSDLIGYTINVEDNLYLLYVLGKNALSADNDSTLKAFFRSFEYVP